MSKATRDIEVGELKVPVIVKNIQNIVVVAADGTWPAQRPHTVSVDASWPVSAQETVAGIEEPHHKFVLRILPEFSLPKLSPGKALAWALQNSAHLFWGIQRQTKTEDWNCELVYREVTCIFAAPPARDDFVGPALDPIIETHSVRVPYIVNTVRILAGKEVVLTMQQLADNKDHKGNNNVTWKDELRSQESKRRKGN